MGEKVFTREFLFPGLREDSYFWGQDILSWEGHGEGGILAWRGGGLIPWWGASFFCGGGYFQSLPEVGMRGVLPGSVLSL